MSTVRRLFVSALLAVAALAIGTGSAFAQGSSTSSIAGTVLDPSGAGVPGADVTAISASTGTTFRAISAEGGAFTIPAVPTGTYTVSVALQGFKTAVLKDVIVTAAGPASIKATLQIGGLEETVTVGAASEIVQTQQTSVASTLNARQIANLPVPGRAAFDLAFLIPGVTTTNGSVRGSIINGLPQSAVNITLDGMNIQDNFLKTTDGMFTRVSPRLDAVDEVTFATAAEGADMAGQGAVQIKFVTKSGTNRYSGTAYYYMQRDWLNTNTWYNTHISVSATGVPQSKPVQANYQPGFSVGGPISIPGLYSGRDKAFFFVNYEQLRSPGSVTNTRTIMSPSSEQGIFQYAGGAPVDLMALAGRNGQTARIDPIVAKLLADVRASTSGGTLNSTTDPLTQSLVWAATTKNTTTYPTVRFDYNLTSKHRVTFTTTRNHILSNPDTTNSRQPAFPGFPVHGLQDSQRYSGQGQLRSTLTRSLVNEVRFGMTGGATKFSPDLATSMFGGTSVADMHGYDIRWNAFRAIQNVSVQNAPSAREGYTRVFEDTLNWIKGAHAISTGFSYTRAGVWLYNQQLVPQIALGIPAGVTYTGDPSDSLFTTANFPNASAADLNNAKNLYYVLTGRVTQIGREARIGPDGNYTVLGASNQYGRLPQYGTFVQDAWRVKPDLTVNAGLRYDLQQPFRSLNDSYSVATMDDIFGVTGAGSGFEPGSTVTGIGNLFKPGTLQGSKTTFKQLGKGVKAYNTDWSNIAPSAGAAWTIGADSGWKRSILGKHGDSVIRAGYNKAYQRGGMSDFTGVFGNNPGIAIDATRNQTNNNLGPVPLLLSGDLSAPAVPQTRTFPLQVPSVSSNVFAFDPNIKTPYGHSFSAGWQRAIMKNTSLEARYVWTKSVGTWTQGTFPAYMNYNELNIVENGFLNEFKIAQQNLLANIAAGPGAGCIGGVTTAGCQNNFAYTGAPGTVPLPIFLAYFTGLKSAGDPNAYKGSSNFASSTFVNQLFILNSNPFAAAGSIRGNAALLADGIAAGMPSNFWVANPDVTNANVVTNGPDTRYNAIQLLLNRRLANGFLLQSNYTYGKGYQYQFYSFHKPYALTEENFSNSGNGSATGNVRHVWSTNWLYELPFGRGKRFGGNVNGAMDRLIGGWSYQGVARVQSGRMIDLGDVRLVGMSAKDVQKAFKTRLVQDPNNPYRTLVYMLPQDIVDNTIKAFSVNATGYTAGAPTGRYFAPPNRPDCIESAQSVTGGTLPNTSITSSLSGFGDCGVRSLIVTGPKVIRIDMNVVKRIAVTGSVKLEAQLQVFNVFNRVNFNPISGIGSSTQDGFQLNSLSSGNASVDQARTMQMAFRVSW
jgi:hypothetical protein